MANALTITGDVNVIDSGETIKLAEFALTNAEYTDIKTRLGIT